MPPDEPEDVPEDVPEDADSNALVLRPNQGAPAPNELTSSADEAEDEDDTSTVLAVGNRIVPVETLDLASGGWAVLHGLSQRDFNGLLVRVCGWKRPTWWGAPQNSKSEDDDRLCVQLVESSRSGQQLRVFADKLQAVRIEEALGRLMNAWLDQGFQSGWKATPLFEVPVWQALRNVDDKERKRERAIVHGLCLDIASERGVILDKLNPDDQITPNGHPNRQVRLRFSQLATTAVESTVATSSGDIRLMPFHELCRLLQALDAVDDLKKGFNARRLHMIESWWRRGARHQRANLFEAFRLLLCHNDARRYYWGASGVAQAVGSAMELDKAVTRRLAETWRDGGAWAQGIEFHRGRDLAGVLQAEWDQRCPPPAAATMRITVGEVNDALDRIDRAHTDRGQGKRTILANLITGRCDGVEIRWLVRILLRHVAIGERPSMPVAHKGEWPKLVMDGLCRAQGRIGRPATGNPPLMYSLFRHQHDLAHVCARVEAGTLPAEYPPPTRLGVHIRAQGSVPLLDTSTEAVHKRLVFTKAEDDRRVYIETKYDGFRLQIHYDRTRQDVRFYYRSGIDSTRDIAPDLEPAMRLALGAPLKEKMLDNDGQPRDRFRWLYAAWARAQEAVPPGWEPPESVVLDGELLVYDEQSTERGMYDEIGSRPGVVGFGTHFWVTVGKGEGDELAGGRYSRSDCRRHYMVQVFDLLQLNGRDLVQEGTPLWQRKELLKHAFVPIPNYVLPIDAPLVDLERDPDALERRFEAARAAGDEGLMVKAACRPYVPNARTNVLKLKCEFISGLGDTVTLLVVGARYARKVGTGAAASLVCELAIAAPTAAGLHAAPSAAGPFGEVTWLFNTAALSYSEAGGKGITSIEHEQMLRHLNEEIVTGTPVHHHASLSSSSWPLATDRPRMRRLAPDEPPPAWLVHMPANKERRPHFILRDVRDAVKVEVLGSRFLTRFTGDPEAVGGCPWKLRFPRVIRWHGEPAAAAAIIPDTLMSYRRKGCEAWLVARGTSWASIAQDLADNGELGVVAGDAVDDDEKDEPDDDLTLHPPATRTPPALQDPTPSKRRRFDVPEGETALTSSIDFLHAMDGAKPLLKAASAAAAQEAHSPALEHYRAAAARFASASNDVLERLVSESIRRDEVKKSNATTVIDVSGCDDERGEGASGTGGLVVAAARPSPSLEQSEPLVQAIKGAGAAYSGVAGILERRTATEGGRPLHEVEIREAVRSRLRAHALYDDAVDAGGMVELAATRLVLRGKLDQLCEREEVKGYLHALLVERMDARHARMPPDEKRDLELAMRRDDDEY